MIITKPEFLWAKLFRRQ